MNALKCVVVAVAAVAAALPANAQLAVNSGEQFVTAIAEGDGGQALKLLQDRPNLVNARDPKGRTALVAAIKNRDRQWIGHLLQKGADPDLPGENGETPLLAAARVGLADAVGWLISVGAKVNEGNRMGETPLIVAVQRRQVQIVRMLLEAGADPDKADSAQGYSARDYARRDSRTPELLRIIEAKRPKP
ncbi:MAG TPA: ankyrin repeat domain-containing protein [Sphingomicrobium sp.]|nr:ankyrin repeat domain-containing protein [Sphingomicrobium sp.]